MNLPYDMSVINISLAVELQWVIDELQLYFDVAGIKAKIQ